MYTVIAVNVTGRAKKPDVFVPLRNSKKVKHSATSIFVRMVKNPKNLAMVSATDVVLFARIR